MDKDEFRRGVPTVHKIWGISTAIIAGDLLFSKSFEALLYLKELSVDSRRIVEAARILAQAASTIAEGQAMDMAFEERTDVTEEEYFQMIYKKTATLFEASTKIGALVGGGSAEDVELIGNYGRNLGIAFQIQDDILGVIGEEEKLGKPVGSDIREGKKTIIVIHALRKALPKDKEKLLEALGNRSLSREKISDVISLLISTGSIDYAKEIALKYANIAKSIIEGIKVKDHEAKEMLIELANYVVKRLK
ncbi:MAG: geranylgeranyl pyrophosphate synthase [Desulfurococcales archaeon ex4484_217_1]|nr:MAG: geranylgeranyl pyrophosphate synthase [Desulfurococcales archaeon ex4484_217_1]